MSRAADMRLCQRTPNAERQHRFRERQRQGLAIVPAEVDLFGFADALVTFGYLRQRDQDDFGAICLAHTQLLADFIEGRYALLGGGPDRR